MELPKVCPNSIHHFVAAELMALEILPHIAQTPAIVRLLSFPSFEGNGIGTYCGAFMASFPISSPNHLIGCTAASVILLAPRAAITAIQRIARARTFTMIVPMTPFPISRAFPVQDLSFGVRSQTVVRVISQNLKVVVESPSGVMVTTSDVIFPSPQLFVAPITSPRNIRPKARAAETYTGTIAREINSLMVNFSSFFALSHSTKVSANTGENIA